MTSIVGIAFAAPAYDPQLFVVGDKMFSNLDGIEGRALEDVVGYHPHVDTIGNGFVLADPAHQGLEFSFTVNSQRIAGQSRLINKLDTGGMG